MTKTIMSIAAAAALLTSGAQAFNTNNAGDILVSATVDGNYSWDNNSTTSGSRMRISGDNVHGDALIYPYFTQEDGWSTEIYVRNDGNRSIVAKVAIYAASDSQEVKDYNIYLSANDSYRFTIKNDKIALDEDSVVTSAPLPQNNDTAGEHDATKVLFGDANPVSIDMDTKKGYVIIYAMAETNTTNVHHNHAQMFGQYRELLDGARTGWRAGFGPGSIANFENGTYKNGITSPALDTGLETSKYTWNDPQPTLTGTVRVTNDGDADNGARDMLLPATAIENFTGSTKGPSQIVLWTEGETANLADRRFDANATGSGVADYSVRKAMISNDANAILTTGFYYRFDNGSAGTIANNLIFTQPNKRVLTQLGNVDGYWTGSATTPLVTGTEYEFATVCSFWDEKENMFTAAGNDGLITSPYNGTPGGEGYNQEVQVLKDADLEKGSTFEGRYDSIHGYASCNLTTGRIPAIVTQMVGSVAGEKAMTNWVYSVKKR